MPSRKRTASRTWRTQKSGLVISSAETSSPVRLDTIGMRGVLYVSPCATSRNASSIPSMRGEWNAWLTVSRLVLRPCASKDAAISTAASSSPAMTTEVGPLRAAMLTRSVSSGSTSSSDACTAIIAPPAGSSCIRRPRAATSFAASSSDSTPATCAAASSPIECPERKSARRPHASTSRNNATSTANNAGCVKPV
jgi:hypothetical protein